jgi:ketosteroid isomerase-like protein
MTKADLLRERMIGSLEEPEAFWAMISSDVEWDISDTDSPMAGVYRGKEAARDFWRRWRGAFSDWSVEVEQTFETEDTVVFFVRERGMGRGSGVPVEMQRANVWTFQGGKVIRFKSFSSRNAALLEAGIGPPRIDE